MKSGVKGNVETLSLSFKYINQGKDLSMLEYLSKIHKVLVLYKTKPKCTKQHYQKEVFRKSLNIFKMEIQ